VRAFVAVAEHLHFRRAAEELHVAQPALSRQIQALERQLGTKLFERDRRSVSLTRAGRQLLEDAVPLLAAGEAARRRAQRAARGPNRLIVGFRTGILTTPAVRAFSTAHPDIAVEVQRLEWDDQEEAILGGGVDVAFVRRPLSARGLSLTPLYTEPRLVALPADHPLAGAGALSTEDLEDEPHLRYMQAVAGSPPLRGVEEKLEHVAAGRGIILLPQSATEYYTRPDIVYVPVPDAEPDEVLLASERARRAPLVSAFAEAARSVGPPAGLTITA
jgi:DNA-binding transcriptional LysR family regulator